jgi:anti-anti-sigma factor
MYDPGGFRIWSQCGIPVVSTADEIDIYNTEQLLHSLLVATAKAKVIVVDMGATTVCDSSAVNVLAWTAQWLNDNDGEMRLVCSTRIQRFMAVTGTDLLFEFFADLPEALAVEPSRSTFDDDLGLVFILPPRDSASDPGHERVGTCAWCQQTPSASWRGRRREFQRALRCHQAYGTSLGKSGQDDNVLHGGRLFRGFVRPVYDPRSDKTAA